MKFPGNSSKYRAPLFACIIGFSASCKPPSTASDTESLRSSTHNWETGKTSNLYLYSWPTKINKANNKVDMCWYYKEVTQDGSKVKFIDGFRTAVQVQKRSLPFDFVRQKLNESIAGHTVNIGLSNWGTAKNCSESVVGATVIATMPVLTGAVAGPTATSILMCAMGIYGIVTSAAALERNTSAHIVAPHATISKQAPLVVKADVLKRIKDAVEQAKESDLAETPCPTSQTVIQGLTKNGWKFPEITL